jgi:adenylate cyclase
VEPERPRVARMKRGRTQLAKQGLQVNRFRKLRLPESYVPPVLALACALATLALVSSGVLDTYELPTYDLRCRWRGNRDPGEDVFLVVVDEGILQGGGFGMFPWPRGTWAAIQSEFIDPLEPHSIVYDILFDQPERSPDGSLTESDRSFAQAIEDSGNVFLAMSFLLPSLDPVSATEMMEYNPNWVPPSRRFTRRFALDRRKVAPGDYYRGTGIITPLQDFERVARGIGHTNTPADRSDKITRRFPLIMEYAGEYYPSLPLVAVCDYVGAELEQVRVTPEKRIIIPGKNDKIIVVPTDRRGGLLLNYYGVDLNIFPSLSMTQFLRAMDPQDPEARVRGRPERMQGKILIVGSIAASTHDLRPTTINQLYPLVGNIATAIVNILRNDFLYETGRWADAFLLILIASLFTEVSLCSQRRFGPLLGALPSGYLRLGMTIAVQMVPAALMGIGYVAAAFLVFVRFGLVIPMFYGLFCLGLSLTVLTVYNFFTEEQNKQWFEQTWGRYMSPEMIQQLRRNPEQLNLGGEEREITILFTDICGFTPMSEKLTPQEVVRLLNEYFDAMVEAVHRHRGMLDKFIGDAMMVHFGTPQAAPDDALRAVKAALEMQQRVSEISARWESQGRKPLRIRIGINTGPVIAGNIGSQLRQEYTAIGDTVNVAQRLEANCPPGQVLISGSTYDRVADHVVAERLDRLHVRGRQEAVDVYLVKALRD